MTEIVFEPFGKQKDIILSDGKLIGGFAGKRGGKTQVGAFKAGLWQETKPNEQYMGVDPYLGVICAPTHTMVKDLSWAKFRSYWRKLFLHEIQSPMTAWWHDHDEDSGYLSMIRTATYTDPQKVEGKKIFWAWLDEVFQASEHFFMEMLARVTDTDGRMICTGSLGLQFTNPKQHWAYRIFKEMDRDFEAECYEWRSADNPYIPKTRLVQMQKTLDSKTYKAMFEICWDLVPKGAVYEDFGDENILEEWEFNPALEFYICVDWGWTHPMSCGFYQYDRKKDIAIKFDEIVATKMTVDELYGAICAKPYVETVPDIALVRNRLGELEKVPFQRITNVKAWACDIAGEQTREQTGVSNVRHFYNYYKIRFQKRPSKIIQGISLVRSYILSMTGERRFFITKDCPKTISGLKRYRYPEKDGIITNELPLKIEDDEVDETRYFFWNFLDPRLHNQRVIVRDR